MNLSTLFLSFVMATLLIIGLVFAGAVIGNAPAYKTSDTWQQVATNQTNSTSLIMANISYAGGNVGLGLPLILACFIVAGGVALLFAYAKTR